MTEVCNHSHQTKVLYLEIRQQVCLLYFFRGSDFVKSFIKNLTKSLPLKNTKATACRFQKATFINNSFSVNL